MEKGGRNTHSPIFPEDDTKSPETGAPTGDAEEMVAPTNGEKKPFIERGH